MRAGGRRAERIISYLGEGEGPVAGAAARELRGLALRRGRGGGGWERRGAHHAGAGGRPRPCGSCARSELSPKPRQLFSGTPCNALLQWGGGGGAACRSLIAHRSSRWLAATLPRLPRNSSRFVSSSLAPRSTFLDSFHLPVTSFVCPPASVWVVAAASVERRGLPVDSSVVR